MFCIGAGIGWDDRHLPFLVRHSHEWVGWSLLAMPTAATALCCTHVTAKLQEVRYLGLFYYYGYSTAHWPRPNFGRPTYYPLSLMNAPVAPGLTTCQIQSEAWPSTNGGVAVCHVNHRTA